MSFFWFISLQLFRISVCNSDRNRCRFCAFRIATWTVKCCDSLRRVSRSRLRPGAPEKWWFGVLENASKHKNTYCMHIAHICHMTILDFVFVTHFLFCIFCDAKLCHAQGWEVNAFCIFVLSARYPGCFLLWSLPYCWHRSALYEKRHQDILSIGQ